MFPKRAQADAALLATFATAIAASSLAGAAGVVPGALSLPGLGVTGLEEVFPPQAQASVAVSVPVVLQTAMDQSTRARCWPKT